MTSPLHRETPHLVPTVRRLLAQTRTVVHHEREMEKVTGARFNLFHLFGVGHYEVTTHSPLLADLLDPQGSHGQSTAFLDLFLTLVRERSNRTIGFKSAGARVDLEYGIGKKTMAEGGRLDILVSDKSRRRIAIENKIHAGEQENWVERYLNYLGTSANEGHLIYLTLYGDEPNACPDRQMADRVICLSYKTDILAWLSACRKEVATVPIVRESLSQYIHLIQHLTQQNISTRMNDAVIDSVLENSDNYQAFLALRDADQAVRRKIIMDLGKRIASKIPQGFMLECVPEGNGGAHEAFEFSTPCLQALGLRASIYFEKSDYRECFYGFRLLETSSPQVIGAPLMNTISELFKKEFVRHSGSTIGWPAWRYWDRKKEWNDEVLEEIQFRREEFDQELQEIIQGLERVARGLEGHLPANLAAP